MLQRRANLRYTVTLILLLWGGALFGETEVSESTPSVMKIQEALDDLLPRINRNWFERHFMIVETDRTYGVVPIRRDDRDWVEIILKNERVELESADFYSYKAVMEYEANIPGIETSTLIFFLPKFLGLLMRSYQPDDKITLYTSLVYVDFEYPIQNLYFLVYDITTKEAHKESDEEEEL